MKIKIISGFLGAGKTTCITNILQKRDAFNAVLVNEFGDIGIDAELIKRGENIDMVELPSGCICCTFANDFVKAVTEIKTKVNPERLIIEPSGLAVPSGILEALEPVQEKLGLEIEAIIGVVDADRFLPNIHSGLFGDFYTDQLANSDIIMINKVDLVPPEVLQAVEEEIRKYNQSAIIIHTVNCETSIPDVEKRQGEHYLHLHSIVGMESGIDRETAEKLVDLAGRIRSLKNSGLEEGVSTRLVIYAAQLINQGIPATESIKIAMINPLTDDITIQKSLDEAARTYFN